MINKIRNIGIFLMVLIATNLLAQNDLPSEQVEILKTFEATLEQSDKLNTSPSLPKIDSKKETLNYKLPTKLMLLDYEPPVIRPIPVAKEKAGKTYHGYLKAGFGTPSSPYLNAIYNGADKRNKFRYSLFGEHHSANNNSNIENQRFSKTDLGINGTAYLKDFAIGGNIGYTRDGVSFYGYPDSLTFAEDDVKQVFNDIHIGAELFNSSITRGDLNYSGKFDFYNFSDNYDASEVGIIINASITKWIDREHPFKVTVFNDFTNYTADLDSNTTANNVFWVNPSYTYIGDGFQVKVGATGGVNSDFFVLPDIEGSVNIAGEKLMLVAGWTGQVQKNTFRILANYNPFINSSNLIRNTTFQKRYGGLKGAVNGISYELIAAQKPVTNLALYLNDSLDTKRFNVLYDDGSIFTIHGAVSLREVIENFDLSASVDYNTYNLNNQARAWHLPILELNIGGKYRLLEDKLTLNAELYTASGVPYLDANGLEQTLNNLLDLNLGGSYQVTDNFGIFLNLNNVTNNRFLRWNNYASYGFNVMGGVTAKF